MSSQVAGALYTASNSKVEFKTMRKEDVTETCILTQARTQEALRWGALPRLAVPDSTWLSSWLSLTHHHVSLASDLFHHFALAWWVVDCWLLSPDLLYSPYLGTVGQCGCCPSPACLPCSWAMLRWQGSWFLLLPGTQDVGRRGREDEDRNWGGRGRQMQKKDSSSSQWNAEYCK